MSKKKGHEYEQEGKSIVVKKTKYFWGENYGR